LEHYWHPTRRQRNEPAAGFLLLLAQVFADCMKIALELVAVLLTNLANFVDDWIDAHDQGSISSSGVQMMGGS
jgi:hypothetical protein